MIRISRFMCVAFLLLSNRTWSGDFPVQLSKKLYSLNKVIALFPTTSDQIKRETEYYLAEAQKQLNTILQVSPEQATFDNVARALDELVGSSDLIIKGQVMSLMESVHPDEDLRTQAREALQEIEKFFVDVNHNKQLYRVFKSYVEGNANKENLSPEQRYFIDETMKEFERSGLNLSDNELQEVTTIQKEIVETAEQFCKNINEDQSQVIVSREGLQGLDEEFIESLKQNDQNEYVLRTDYPTYFRVMEQCQVEDTRQRLYQAFNSRAYPSNKPVLKTMIALRDRLAKKLGYPSYAHLDLENQMVQTPERAEQFNKDILDRAKKKEDQEFELLVKDLPESVSLTPERKVKAWDIPFLYSEYKKKHYEVDEQKISEYFPVQQTIERLLDIYRTFMSIDFEEVEASGLWHDDVKVLKVYNQDKSVFLGNVFLDLYPRPNKYSHAAHFEIVPAVKCKNGNRIPSISSLVCNFPRPTKTKPALLKRSEVTVFFHEFGHALHALLGATEMASFSGTNVKDDFAELPSQILEEWLNEGGMLKKVSSHYETNDSLSDEMVNKILGLKKFNTGYRVRRQGIYSRLSLSCFKEGENKDPDTIEAECHDTIHPHIEYGTGRHVAAAFGHLNDYAAKYYGYMWSKVFALDMFDTIKQHGLLNPEIGKKYVQEVIGRGGSCDPNELLANFLGREPKIDAFMKHMGFKNEAADGHSLKTIQESS